MHWATHRLVPSLHACLEPVWAEAPDTRGGATLYLPLDAKGTVTGLDGSGAKSPHADCFADVLVGVRLPRRPNQVEGRAQLKLSWHPTPGEPLAPLEAPKLPVKSQPMTVQDWWEHLRPTPEPLDEATRRAQEEALRKAKEAAQAAWEARTAQAPPVPSEPPLALSVTTGDAPLEVRIVGPQDLTEQGTGSRQRWRGCGYTVAWGDGTSGPGDDCASGQVHRYNQPGTYVVKALRSEPGPTDAHITQWASEATVTVTGTVSGSDTVQLVKGPGDEPLWHSQPIVLSVEADPRGPATLVTELFAEGQRLHRQAGAEVSGPMEQQVMVRTDLLPAIDEFLLRGQTDFDVRVGLERDGRPVGKRISVLVSLSDQPPPNGVVVQAYEARPGEVWLEANKGALSEHEWWVDWGDGTTEAGGVRRLASSRDKPPMAPIRHTYKTPGTYSVDFRYDTYPGARISTEVKVTGGP